MGAAVVDFDKGGTERVALRPDGRRVNLVRLAVAQRWLIVCILARVVIEILGVGMRANGVLVPDEVLWAGWVAMVIVTAALVARMARAYGADWFSAVCGGLVMALPLVGIFLLVLLNQGVVGTLGRAGVRIGLMGVEKEEMHKLREGVCAGCGYDIRGLSSAVCPECGGTLEPPIAIEV